MKKNTLILFFTFITLNISGQTKFYSETKTFHESGYTYQCDVSNADMITLYNKENRWTYQSPAYKDSGEIYIAPEDGFYPLLMENEQNSQMDNKCIDIARKHFSVEQKQSCKGRHSLLIYRHLNPDTGRIEGVDFIFFKRSNFTTIPISVFCQIELELKREIKYDITDRGKKLNFIFYWFEIKFD